MPGLFCLIYGIAFIIALEEEKNKLKNKKKQHSFFLAKLEACSNSCIFIHSGGGFVFGAMTFCRS